MTQRPLYSLSLPPSTIAELAKAGYENLSDIPADASQVLQLGISVAASQAVIRTRGISTSASAIPSSQSAASMVKTTSKISTGTPPLDRLLSGGIYLGHALEISGPPGSPKEAITMGIVKSFVQNGHEVIFVDTQNMTSSTSLCHYLDELTPSNIDYLSLVTYSSIHTLSELLVFMHNLPSYLQSHPVAKLLVVSCISFPLQPLLSATAPSRNVVLDRIKQSLAKACLVHNIAVVTTSQLSVKLVNSDGTTGSFDTAVSGVMVPQLGPGYLPSGRSYRILMARDDLNSGTLRLLSCPTNPSGKGDLPQEKYTLNSEVLS